MPPTASGSPAERQPRILVCGWAGAGNVGDELLTRAAVALFRSAGAAPVVASRDPDTTTRIHDVESVPWGPRGAGSAATVDGACVGPGGIVQDSSSLWSLPGHLVLPGLVKRRGGALVGLGLGAEPLKRRSSAALLRAVLRDTPVLCRDPESSAALASAGIDSEVAPDLAFSLPQPDVSLRDELVVAIGPEVRPGRLTPASQRLESGDLEQVASTLDAIAGRLGVGVALAAFRGARDRAMAGAVARRMRVPTEVLGDDVDEHVARVAGAALVLTSRYHALVVALRSGTPAIVISGQAKLASLVQHGGGTFATAGWATVARMEPDLTRREPVLPDTTPLLDAAADTVARAAATPARGFRR